MGKLFKRIAFSASVALLIGLTAVPAQADGGRKLSSAEVEAQIDAYVAKHPNDIVGLSRLSKRLTGAPTRVSLNRFGTSPTERRDSQTSPTTATYLQL